MSVNNTDPALLFGGEWERIEGRFLLAASTEYEAGNTGGEAKHKLTVSEMPSHAHAYTYSSTAPTAGSFDTAGGNTFGDRVNGRTTSSTGGNVAHNNLPPYLVVYMWQRLA